MKAALMARRRATEHSSAAPLDGYMYFREKRLVTELSFVPPR
jgi:hypothetical protein